MIRGRGWIVVVAAVLGCGRGGARIAHEAPPVVLISIDTLRADRLPAYGYARGATPHIDALRADAVLFANAYTHVPLTLPAHVSLFTGALPPVHGVRDNLGYRLDAGKHPTLAQRLKERGYTTGGAVSAYVLRRETGIAHGFDFYEDVLEAPEGVAAAGAVQRAGGETLDRLLPWFTGVQARPFFLFFHLYEPHSPFDPPAPFKQRHPDPYDGEVAAADAIVGRLLDELRTRGLYERALIVLVSDHGEGLGDHGEEQHGILLYREALHVPLLVKLPGGRRRGERVAAPVGLVDVLPTVAEVAGVDLPKGAAGRSLLQEIPSAPVYSETFYPRAHLGWSELRSLVDARWHYIESPRSELYDIAADPGERSDVIASEGDTRHTLRDALYKIPAAFMGPSEVRAEDRERLAALGYLGGAASGGDGPPPNPRDRIQVIRAVETAFRLAAAGRKEEAVAAMRRILQDDPQLMDVLFEMGRVLSALGRHEEAYQAYRRAVRASPAMAAVMAVPLARACLETNRLDEAALHAQLALASSPGPSHEILARVALARQDLARAESHLAQVQRDAQAEANRILLEAEIAIRRERFDDALARLDAGERAWTTAGRPRPRDLSFLRGDALARLGRHAEAAAAFEREITDHPANVQAYARLAIVYGLLKRTYGDVDRLLERMYQAAPSAATAGLAAETLEIMGDARGARAWRQRRSPRK
jgi:choline-sulfatase